MLAFPLLLKSDQIKSETPIKLQNQNSFLRSTLINRSNWSEISAMACIKGINRSASVAFAPDAPYMAAGTMAGAVDLSFSSSANLEIFKLDFQSEDRDLLLVGESPSSERFNRLAWGKNGSISEDFSLGLVAGGLVDGSIDIWNPLSLIR